MFARCLHIVPVAVLLGGCAHSLGTPRVSYSNDIGILPLVQPSTDARRWYVPLDEDHLLFVDSGYSSTTCDDTWVEALNLTAFGRRKTRGEVGDVIVQKAVLPPFELAGHTIEDLVCVVRDIGETSSIKDPTEVPVAAVLGADVLRAFFVVLDPEAGQITLQNPENSSINDENSLPIRREHKTWTRFRVPIEIEGKRTWPLVDTGASNTYVDGDALKLEATYTDENVQVRATGPGGVITTHRTYFEVEQLDVGPLSAGPLTLTDRNRGLWAPGLLGLDVLDQFRVELDFQSNRARFTPAKARANPSWNRWKRAISRDNENIEATAPEARQTDPVNADETVP
ncbi:MAG: hypothetical protein GWP91_18875 [Rhodobacterales bacterium]|nr:hypothetical protein [Rhodobacterales bacterium]